MTLGALAPESVQHEGIWEGKNCRRSNTSHSNGVHISIQLCAPSILRNMIGRKTVRALVFVPWEL